LNILGSDEKVPQITFEKVYTAVDIDESGTIDKGEMVVMVREILKLNIKGVVNYAWTGYKVDKNGALNKQ